MEITVFYQLTYLPAQRIIQTEICHPFNAIGNRFHNKQLYNTDFEAVHRRDYSLFSKVLLRGMYNFTAKLTSDIMIIHFVVLPRWDNK